MKKALEDLEMKVQERTAELLRANQMLKMMSECNLALLRSTDEVQLMQSVCNVIHFSGYSIVWVGLAEQDADKTIRPVASAGVHVSKLKRNRCSWAENRARSCPTSESIAKRRVCVANYDEANMAKARKTSCRPLSQSIIALPLCDGDRVFGAITLEDDRPDIFDQEQITLLRDMADNLAFGIAALRIQAERDTAARELEGKTAQLRALASELTQADQRERRRLSNVLHDHLQQLLVAAQFSLDSLRRMSIGKDAEAAVAAAEGLLEESLELSHSLTMELSPSILYDAGLDKALKWLARWYRDKHGLDVKVSADAKVVVEDEDLRSTLYQAAREMLFNVVKHAKTKTASLSLRHSPDGRIVIVVSDRGVGFEPKDIRAMGGTTGGFGLFTLTERVGQLGGAIELESSLGKGSRFTLIVPIRCAGGKEKKDDMAGKERPSPIQSTRRMPPHKKLTPPRQKIRVLLADDHETIRDGLTKLLEDQGDIIVVGVASDGGQAVDLARSLSPDVAVLDINMPVINGIEAARLIASAAPRTWVIGLTMHAEPEHVAAMCGVGALTCLDKAASSSELIDSIRQAFRRPARKTPTRNRNEEVL